MRRQGAPPLDLVTEHRVGADRRSVHLRRTRLDQPGNGDTDVLVAPGFAQTSRQSALTACYLATNGLECVRYDALDHPGLSDGAIRNFTMSSALHGLQVALDACARPRCVVIANSIAARAAFRLAATSDRVVGVIAIVGVVNLRSTLHRVLGQDHSETPFGELPATYEILGHDIEAAGFAADAGAHGWWSAEAVIHEVAGAPGRITNVVAGDDDWVSRREAEWVMRRGGGSVAVLADATHVLATDWASVRTILGHVTGLCADWIGGPDRGGGVRRPSFAEIAAQSVAERTLERRSGDAVAGAPVAEGRGVR